MTKGYKTMKTLKSLLTAVLAVTTVVVTARESEHVKRAGGAAGAKAAGCSPSIGRNELDLNNVRARIETGGNMWQIRESPAGPGYEVPKTPDRSGPDALFAGALWLGGKDPAGNLKLAAVRFRQIGNDYWPGPLDTIQGTITADQCEKYDRTWKTLRSDVEQHVAYFSCLSDPECDPAVDFPNGWVVPTVFHEWPAMGDVSLNQSLYLAPFGETPGTGADGNGEYDPEGGDYPGFDLNGVQDCKNRFRGERVTLYGDMNIWWVFNDKGNTHTETQGQPIGMEIRSQAFAFSTNDEINNMTFYNYELYNRGTLTLEQTYFGQWVDPDLGGAIDDYVGCDVRRGLGYAYNGDNDDQANSGHPGYGVQPPAVGVDFFEGPYQDSDGIDNPLTDDCQLARDMKGIVYEGIGIGYGDTVPDNERFGMRAFLYHNNDNTNLGDPSVAPDYYNFLLGVWKDNTPMTFGGTGYSAAGGNLVNSHYMFPGDSDPLYWGTSCTPTTGFWSETTTLGSPAINPPGDRRFIQSAGPFTLEPGDYNNITVGVVWARATTGGPLASVELVRRADDKAQALFDNCFKILDGPDAPNVSFQELDKEILLYLTNPSSSNNFNEQYVELDPTIPEETVDMAFDFVPDSIVLPDTTIHFVRVDTLYTVTQNDRYYRFQGYQIYQVKSETVGPEQLTDQSVARLVAQVDLQDNISRIINYETDPTIGLAAPVEKVNGANNGVRHAFRITEDLFAAEGSTALVNFKTYHFMAIAYGHNSATAYNPVAQTGQAFPYKASRKAAAGSIRTYSAIPHKPGPEAFGTVQNAQFGDRFPMTRLEGQGNGGLELELTKESEESIVAQAPWRQDRIVYRTGLGPVNISVVDPLKVPAGDFEFWLLDGTGVPNPVQPSNNYLQLEDAEWMLVRLTNNPTSRDTVYSTAALSLGQEQLVLDWGLSVHMRQSYYTPRDVSVNFSGPMFSPFLGSNVEPFNSWYVGIPDQEDQSEYNWIRSGSIESTADNPLDYPDYAGVDVNQVYETAAGGTWAPWVLVGQGAMQPSTTVTSSGATVGAAATNAKIAYVPSVQVVFTPDRTKWTRSVVFETHATPANTTPANVAKLSPRPVPSVDKSGIPLGSPGCNEAEASVTSTTSMGWFPGYVVALETGERLNVAFGEDSFIGGTEGRDMLWNPSSNAVAMGGGHWIYVYGNRRQFSTEAEMPLYDEGAYMRAALTGSATDKIRVWKSCVWVGSGLIREGTSMRSAADGLVPSEVRIRLNVARPYNSYVNPYAGYQPNIQPERNNGLPLYTFNTGESHTETGVASVAESMLDIIGVVPNPYYAFSGYETSRLDNRVKFINLPPRCTISIYNVGGTLVRKFRKDNELTYLDWDLKNGANVPISSGTYICHIDVPDVGERVLKWFGVMRPVDLQNF